MFQKFKLFPEGDEPWSELGDKLALFGSVGSLQGVSTLLETTLHIVTLQLVGGGNTFHC